MNSVIWIVSSVILAFLIGLLVPNPFHASSTTTGLSYGIQNPEMIFSNQGSCFKVGKYWKGDSMCYNGTIDGDIGSVIIVPYPFSNARFIYQTFVVPKTANKLEIKLEDASGKPGVGGAICPSCNATVSLELIDHYAPPKVVYPIDTFQISQKDGWVIKSYNISGFRGHPVSLVIYVSKAPGQKGERIAIASVKIV